LSYNFSLICVSALVNQINRTKISTVMTHKLMSIIKRV
jgi:hypothetical protein